MDINHNYSTITSEVINDLNQDGYLLTHHGDFIILYYDNSKGYFNEHESNNKIESKIQKVYDSFKQELKDEDIKEIYKIIRRRITDKGILYQQLIDIGTDMSGDGYSNKKDFVQSKKENKKQLDEIDNFVEGIIELFYPVTIKGDKEELFLWYDGYYHGYAQSELKDKADKYFRKIGRPDLIDPGRFGTILHKIKSHKMIDGKELKEPKNKINLLSNILDISNIKLINGVVDKSSIRLEPHNPNYYFLYKMNVDYNPDARCPKIRKFFGEISEINDPDEPDNVWIDLDKYWLFIEVCGYCLISDYFIKKYFMILGSGDNGKTTLENLLKRFFTEKNIMSLSLYQLCEKDFLASNLLGKKLNIRGEMDMKRIGSLEPMKNFTGGDTVTLDRKYRDPLHLDNTARFIFHFNKLPFLIMNKMDEQAWKRIILIILTKKFIGKNDDKDIIKKLTTKEELEGFLLLCIHGLARLILNGNFTYDDDSTIDNWLIYAQTSDSDLNLFIDDELCIEKNWNNIIPRDELIEKYIEYRKKNKYVYKQISKTKFTQSITAIENIGTTRRIINDKKRFCYTNVRYKNEKEKSGNNDNVKDMLKSFDMK